jgi:glycosyltransferase involved in cell wall biosynthesis
MKKNLLIITQGVDEEDDLLGFFVDWISEFAKYFETVNVVAFFKGKYNLPNNVHVYSLGKEKNSSKISRTLIFYKYLWQFMPKSDGVFAHMSPIFVVASWPVAILFRKKIIFWYLHRSVTLRLRLALMMCYKLVTAAKESLRIKSHKIIQLGHGINIHKFKNQKDWAKNDLSILSVGRISPIKNFETIIKAVKILKDKNLSPKLTIVGQPKMPNDFQYADSLKDLVKDLNLENDVEFVGFVKHSQVADYYKKNNYFVGALPDGGIDKAMLEAMASGCIVFTSNVVFSKYFAESWKCELLFPCNDFEGLASRILGIINLDASSKKDIGDGLVKSVVSGHDLENLIGNIVEITNRI